MKNELVGLNKEMKEYNGMRYNGSIQYKKSSDIKVTLKVTKMNKHDWKRYGHK